MGALVLQSQEIRHQSIQMSQMSKSLLIIRFEGEGGKVQVKVSNGDGDKESSMDCERMSHHQRGCNVMNHLPWMDVAVVMCTYTVEMRSETPR